MTPLLLFFAKSYVQGHTRRLKNGQVVQVQAHYDKRTKKGIEHAPDHNHDVAHLSDADKAKFSLMHKEQHLIRFYAQHALERKLDGEKQLLANLEKSAALHEAKGDKKSVTIVHNKIIKLKQSIMRHEKMLARAKGAVEGIGRMKAAMVTGSGALSDNADKAHAHYVGKLGAAYKDRPVRTFKPDLNKEADSKQKDLPARERAEDKKLVAQLKDVAGADSPDEQRQAVIDRYQRTDGWLKAPNGQPTKLNEQQWVAVRTPAFKAWFGDWEIAAAKPIRQAETFAQARKAVSAIQNKPLKNSQTGLEATLSRNNLDKMLSSKAVGKSESTAGHSLAVANIDSLFERAILGWSKPDRDGNTNLKAIHRFFAPLTVNGQARLVKMTVKEFVSDEQGRKIYSVESIELDEKTPAAQWVDAAAQDDNLDPTSIRSAEAVKSLARAIQNFNPNAVSKVVDDNGEPLVVYHGTDADFDTFDANAIRREGRRTSRSSGISLSLSKDFADSYARFKNDGHVMPLFVNAKKVWRPDENGGKHAIQMRQLRCVHGRQA